MADDLTASTTKWLMIADAHLICADDEPAFFKMLAEISSLPGGIGIIFLGDIFDLWIAYRGYEAPAHRRFLDWCRAEKTRRAVIFLEGNHEFFVKQRYQDAFTYCSETIFRHDRFLCVHGDRINRKDRPYTVLRFFIRSGFARFLLWCTAWTIGPCVSHFVREKLRNLNQKNKRTLPEAQIRRALCEVAPGTDLVFAGHFHSRHSLTEGAVRTEILPAYKNGGELAYYDENAGTFEVAPFEQLPPMIHNNGNERSFV